MAFELNRDKGYSIEKLCKALDVSRSGYYKWLDRKPSDEEAFNDFLATEIREIHKDSNEVFGVERVQLALYRDGLNINVKRVRRIMRIEKISSVIRRKKEGYVKSTPEHTAENIINRDFEAPKKNQKWFIDVTYLKAGGMKYYMCAIIDRHDMTIIARKISRYNDNPLVKETLEMAFKANPNARPIIHSDRGSQFTSGLYKEMSLKYGFTMSMSRVSKCLDNQPIESFFGTFKSEFYYRHKFDSYESLLDRIDDYMDFYMNRRFVKKFGGLTPAEFRVQSLFVA